MITVVPGPIHGAYLLKYDLTYPKCPPCVVLPNTEEHDLTPEELRMLALWLPEASDLLYTELAKFKQAQRKAKGRQAHNKGSAKKRGSG